MFGITRRSVLWRTAATSAVIGIATLSSQSVVGESDTACCDADSGLATDDSEDDGCASVDSSDGGNYEHGYNITATADVDDSPSNCKGEEVTTELFQERKYCSDGSTSFIEIDQVSVSVGPNEGDSNGTSGLVSTVGDNWVATGTYKVKVEACEIDEGDEEGGCYDWDKVCAGSCSKTFQVLEELDNCDSNITGPATN
jgi:hypothetical protein